MSTYQIALQTTGPTTQTVTVTTTNPDTRKKYVVTYSVTPKP